MRTTDQDTCSVRGRSRRGTRLALAGLVAVIAALALPGIAGAATHPAKVGNLTVSPALAGHGGFGLYHFDVTAVNSGDSFAFPFLTGSKIGHCVEATVLANNSTATLRTDTDLSLSNSDPANTIGSGLTTGAQRVEWILLDSYRSSPGDATGVQGAAHQSAIWHLTNPSSPGTINITGSSANELAAASLSAKLISDSQANYASVANVADLSIDGGADAQTCAGTSRTVTVTGSPFTDATLTLAGPGHFHTGGATTTVSLGATGKAQVQVDSTGAGQIDVTASIRIATMVQADNGGNQDYVYLEFQTVSKKVSLVFTNCQNVSIAKTATPLFVRAYDWTITKSVDRTSVTTANGSATFNYTVAVTKSAPVDSGWMVSGTITVTNPNVNPVTAVTVVEKGVDNGGVCVLAGTGSLGTLTQNQSGSVGYTCTYAVAPVSATGTNTAQVTWTMPGSGSAPTTQSASVTQAFTFGAPASILHDSVNVGDIFDGAAPAILAGGANLTGSKTFTYSRTVAVPASGCRIYNNTANVTATDVPSYSKDATVSVTTCRETPPVTPPVGPAAVPSRTTISLTKSASSPTVKAGGTVSFLIKWKNTGKATAKNVVICDDLPNQLTFVTAKGATFKNGKACWTRKSVAKGTTLTFRVVARVDASVGNEKLVNVATATASNAKPATAKAPVRALRNARTRAGGVTG
jgi:uncharacterized repeat protein (TIGR01451 family)